jgi:hypothetical protein
MRRLGAAVAVVLALALVLVACFHDGPSLSAEDRSEITALVRAQTSEPILGLGPVPLRLWRLDLPVLESVEVRTGTVRGPLDGGGSIFVLRRSRGRWCIVETGIWVS